MDCQVDRRGSPGSAILNVPPAKREKIARIVVAATSSPPTRIFTFTRPKRKPHADIKCNIYKIIFLWPSAVFLEIMSLAVPA